MLACSSPSRRATADARRSQCPPFCHTGPPRRRSQSPVNCQLSQSGEHPAGSLGSSPWRGEAEQGPRRTRTHCSLDEVLVARRLLRHLLANGSKVGSVLVDHLEPGLVRGRGRVEREARVCRHVDDGDRLSVSLRRSTSAPAFPCENIHRTVPHSYDRRSHPLQRLDGSQLRPKRRERRVQRGRKTGRKT